MERKTGTASTDEKEALRIAKSDEAKRHDNPALKEQNSGVTHPEKNKLRRVPKTERTSG
ncbi:MAG: hypothetical protein ING36_12750 [Burkholderiales bacterium]|nr:hypothetical protein [Burkholderiales bacterium]